MKEREITAMDGFQTSMRHGQEFYSCYTVPYTMEELHGRIAMAERDAAAGLGQDSEEMFRELEELFSREEMEVTA